MSDPTTLLSQVQSPLDLGQLTQQVAELQARLDTIESKLPFQNMAAITLVASENNMKGVSENGSTFFQHQIKIDHPLCNNNPKAVVFAVNQADSKQLAAVNIFYNAPDTFWYISTPDLQERGFEIDVIVDAHPTVIAGVSGSDHPDFKVLQNTTFETTQGIAYVGPRWPILGQRFSVLIFTELPIQVTTKQGIDIPTVVSKGSGVTFSGDWNYKFVSASGATFTGSVSLQVNDTSVTGTLVVSDGSKGALVGTLINNVLSLTRDTGLQTVQVLQLNGVDANHFSGTYLNHGKSADSGNVEFSR